MKKIIGIILICICVVTCFLRNESKSNIPEAGFVGTSLSVMICNHDNASSSLDMETNNVGNDAVLLNVNELNRFNCAKNHHEQRLLQQAAFYNTLILSGSHFKTISKTLSYDFSSFWGRTLLSYIHILLI